MNPEIHNNINVDAQIAAMEQAAEAERRQQFLTMASFALRFHNSNPDLANALTTAAVVNYYRPEIEAAAAATAWHAQHQQSEARNYHDRDNELVGSNS